MYDLEKKYFDAYKNVRIEMPNRINVTAKHLKGYFEETKNNYLSFKKFLLQDDVVFTYNTPNYSVKIISDNATYENKTIVAENHPHMDIEICPS